MRGGKGWFVVEKKSFEISVEVSGEKLRGVIVKRSIGFSSWICFGQWGLESLLQGVEVCCKQELSGRLIGSWAKGGRKYTLEQRSNKAGCFLLCSVLNQEARRFSLVFLEGRGLLGGWETLENKLRSLGVGRSVLSGSRDIRLAPMHREKKPSYADVTKEHFGRAGDALWLQLRDSETDSLERLEDHVLVGRWSGREESSID